MDLLGSVAAKVLTTRSLVRAPIALYRHGLGRLLGTRMMMLQHTGRTTARARYVCLEVVERPASGRLVVVSGFGTNAQWYRNLLADPHCRVSSGRDRDLPAMARPMNESESEAVLARYARDHPGAWRRLRAGIEKAVGHPVEGLPMVELVLDRPSTA